MIEEERMEANRLEELRDREACGYDGEAPYFQNMNQPFTPEQIEILKKLADREIRHE